MNVSGSDNKLSFTSIHICHISSRHPARGNLTLEGSKRKTALTSAPVTIRTALQQTQVCLWFIAQLFSPRAVLLSIEFPVS